MDACNTITLNPDEAKDYAAPDSAKGRKIRDWVKAKAAEQHAKNGLPVDLYQDTGAKTEGGGAVTEKLERVAG